VTVASRASSEANIGSLLVEAAERHPEQAAVLFRDDELSYRDLDAAVERLATTIAAAAGDDASGRSLRGARIGVIAGNEPALVTALFAVWRLGAIVVPLSARLREHELGRILADSEITLLLSIHEGFGYSFEQLLPRLLPELSNLRACLFITPSGETGPQLQGNANAPEPDSLSPDVAAILYTSGTTGRPKGVLVTHERELYGSRELGSLLELGSEDTVAFVIALVHAFGLSCLLATIRAGGTAALVESTFSAAPLLTAIEERQVSILHGPPVLFAGLMKARPAGFAGVRTGFVAGASTPPELLERLDAVGMRILNLYGLTESGAVACCRQDDPPQVRYSTVGRPLPGVEARVADREGGQIGLRELEVRGAHVVPRYLRPDAAEGAAVDGWFRTGDLAEIDEGNVFIVGRSKELVHVGGFNVFPSEVEAVLLAHPDVLQVAVVGVPHEKMGEALQAFVVARPEAELDQPTLLRFARPRIAGYKLPYAIQIVPELPILASGKPDRVALAGTARAAGARVGV
jgi:acyl-CoA synthetase (AMP-forming)/AMP-acid ligase II